jgi:putative phage-type endonuclease
MTGPAIIHSDREQWLARRRELITASDVAAILGEDPRRGPLAVYAEKIGVLEPEENRAMRRGRRLEPVIAEEYSEETGRPVFPLDPYDIAIHPDVKWMGATRDRETAGCEQNPGLADGRAPLELKGVAGSNVRAWRDDPPAYFQIQVQIQMACTGAQWGSLTALLSGLAITWKDLARDDRFLRLAYPRLDEFRLRVLRRDPPDADGLHSTGGILRALYADGDGETVYLGDDSEQLVDEWEKAKADERDGKARGKRLRNTLMRRIGANSFGNLPDGSWLARRTVERDDYEVEGTTYQTLRREWPKVPRRI